jgi:hypothetical protein
MDVENLLGTVIVGGIAYKIADDMIGKNQQRKERKRKTTSSNNAYTRERQVFNSNNKNSPF